MTTTAMAVPLIPGRVLVGSYLLHLRLDLAWSQEPATRLLRCSTSKISRIEAGLCRLSPRDLDDLLRCYKATRTQQTIARSLVPLSPRAGAYANVSSDVAPGWTRRLMHAERAATAIRVYASTHVPAILATPAYAAAVYQPIGLTGEAATTAQLRILRPTHRKSITLLLDEAVLLRPTGGAAVMTTQLASLQAAAAQDGVQILVVPLMASGFLRQPMSELTLRQYAEPLYAEEGVAAVYAAGLDGQLRGQIMDTIQAAAWTAEQSADVLEEARARFAREAKFA